MSLPTFLGIGAQRSGSSWLYQQLKNHPDIFMPDRKEIHFFDRNYSLGLEWYKKFFPVNDDLNNKVCGEISPGYLYDEDAAQRISECIPDCKIIVIFRNPIDRCYSQYKYSIRNNAEQRTFIEYVQQTEALKISLYRRQIERFLKLFPSNNILCLIFEEVMSNPSAALKEIGDFLAVDSNKFLFEDLQNKVNSSDLFRFNYLFGMSRSYFKKLRKQGLYVEPITKILKKVYFALPENILYSKIDSLSSSSLDPQNYYDLLEIFQSDINALEVLLGKDLSIWRTLGDSSNRRINL